MIRRDVAVVSLAALLAGCGAQYRGAAHHDPSGLWAELTRRGIHATPAAEAPQLAAAPILAVLPFGDEVPSPTGILISEPHGGMLEVYVTPDIPGHLERMVRARLARAGARVVALDAHRELADLPRHAVVLDLTVEHAELHRLQRGERDNEWPTWDLVRIDYRYRFLDAAGRPVGVEARASERLLLEAEASDDLEVASTHLVEEILSHLPPARHASLSRSSR